MDVQEFQGALMVVNEVESTWSKARNTLTAYVTISSIGFALLRWVLPSSLAFACTSWLCGYMV